MGTTLDFISSDGFRKKLITRNLVPYVKSPSRPSTQTNFEYLQSDLAVIDSPDELIDESSFANKLYPLNQFGAEGGYKQTPDPSNLYNNKSNEGEYGPFQQDAKLLSEGIDAVRTWRTLNAYSDALNIFDSAESFSSLDVLQVNNGRQANGQPYPTFNSSSYNPVSILLSLDPQGSNGLLSQDSFIARLGAQTLKKEFEARIATQIRQQTVGRANIANVRSGTDILNLVTGRVPVIEPNYTITVPANPILAATDFALRLAGSTIPVSPIPGSYWDPSINPGQPTTIQQITGAFAKSAVGNFFNRLLGSPKTGSQLFYNNMGSGQKSRLFGNIDYNKYKPSFDRTLFDRVGGVIAGSTTNNSNYYIGSTSAEPSRVFSPSGDLPINSQGIEQQSPVYGPQELAQLYEGPSKDVRLGANGPTYSNGGGIEGGFTWVSPKYKDNAGKKVGVGGLVANQDEDFKPSSYNTTESTNRTFREGSILDDTQRIINSQPQGGKRLQHVGNAIDQVSKVFHDGYKEITKGSKVLTYIGAIGQEVGSEYCRIFTKDTPYLQYNDLQKEDGVTTEGRRFSYSVLDKTYNLNIAPNKQEGGQDSTNLIGNTNTAYAKKYMFSLENLAWRTSNAPGFSVSDLPICERGPNGGRVMWFPPYGLTFTEGTSANWNQSDFIGRPEPIFTYKNTSRTGTLQWKIVVDHPSVLNVIVNKILNNETNKTRVDSILESFFAGCRKYDLYELAKKYYTINPNDLYQLQQAITSKTLTKEEIQYSKQTIQSGVDGGNGQDLASSNQDYEGSSKYFTDKYVNFGFYFGNDYPKKDGSQDYNAEYVRYTSQENRDYYAKKSASTATETSQFFDNVVISNYDIINNLAKDIKKQLIANPKGEITITVDASCSAPADQKYNLELANRRIDSMINWFKTNEFTKEFISSSPARLQINRGINFGERALSNPKSPKVNYKTYRCSDSADFSGGDTLVGAKEIFTAGAMACRRAYISSITSNITQPQVTPKPKLEEVVVGNTVTTTTVVPQITEEYVPRNNITKRVLRALLSECDYFETIKSETPMVYDNLKDKLKFFQPAFHSTTPEGLNSRLTFLQQAMRPGDTIPTIKSVNGKDVPTYNNATNTAFGAPPVLVLRIGDFYNTKIIPTGLQLTYEHLDINPEGIGIQPMIANVSLNFNFVGGSGLKESVDKLQNALTFNYYANTEMWDDRADTTDNEEFLSVMDKEFLAKSTPPAQPTKNDTSVYNGQNNNSAVGIILTNSATTSGQTGTLSYSDFMVKVVEDTQNYFTNVVNKTKETVNQYNNAVRQQWMLTRNYTQGAFTVSSDPTTNPTILFGKPSNVEQNFDKIFDLLLNDIKNQNEGFIQFLLSAAKDLSPRVITTIKDNYYNFVKNKKSSFQSAITNITQSMVISEQNYIQTLGRLNLITFEGDTPLKTGTDGYQEKSGPVVVYVTSGTPNISKSSINVTDTFEELFSDARKIHSGITDFNKIIWNNTSFIYSGNKQEYKGILVYETSADGRKLSDSVGITNDSVFIPFSKNDLFSNFSFRKVYMIVSDNVVDDKKYETFKKALIGNTVGNTTIIGNGSSNIEIMFDAYWKGTAKPAFVEENNITKEFIDKLEKNELKNFLKYTPFDKKERVLTYSTENNSDDARKKSQQNLIKGLANSTNQNTNINTWNDLNGNSAGAYISKTKLN
jgi:hypothetical protein